MLFRILLEPLLALSLIRDLVQEFLTDIEEINIRKIYGCDREKGSECSYFISGDQKMMPLRSVGLRKQICFMFELTTIWIWNSSMLQKSGQMCQSPDRDPCKTDRDFTRN